MADSTISDLLRIRRLRKDRAERRLREARAVLLASQTALSRARTEAERFSESLSDRIEHAYRELQQEADVESGVMLHRVRGFRDFETHMHKQLEALRLVVAEKQKAVQEASKQVDLRLSELHVAERACLKLETLSKQQAERLKIEQERAEDKNLEEFKPQSIFAQMS